MLQLVLGRSGTGKTSYIEAQLSQLTEAGGTALLLVPEQYSFESERTLLKRLGTKQAARVSVVSFTRLAERVFEEVGVPAGRRMDDATRALLMSRALEQTADQLTLYRRHAAHPEYLAALLALLSECKQSAVTPEALCQAAQQLETGTLRQKMEELGLIFSTYEALTAQSYLDPLDDLTVLADRVAESRFLAGTPVWVDGFKGFTAQELRVLDRMMAQVPSVTVTLCTDTLHDDGELGLFAGVARTAARLQECARRHAVTVARPVVLSENRRTASEALRMLEENAFAPLPEVWEQPAPEVTTVSCGDIYEECAEAARTVRRLLREQGGRCRDFAVVVRDLANYQGILEPVFERAEIPFYMDHREPIHSDPLLVTVLAALHGVTGRFDTEEMLRLMKTGVTGFSVRSAAQVENYVLLWQIGGRTWEEEWRGNPRGWDIRADETDEAKLCHLNRLRRRLVSPLLALRRSLSGAVRGEMFSRAVYTYLKTIRADRLVTLQVKRLEAAGEIALARRQSRMWEVVMDLLDRFAAVWGEASLSAARYAELFELVVRETKLGDIPPSLDAVQIGTADRMRFSAPRTVLILGANEGVFPAYPENGSLISDSERRRLTEQGISLADTGEFQAAEERFFAYAALAAPSERLYVLYHRGTLSGEPAVPSVLVERLNHILPQHRRETALSDGTQAQSAAEAFAELTARWERKDAVKASLEEALRQEKSYVSRLQSVRQAALAAPAAFREETAAQALFGDNLTLSSSKVEQYHRCRFAYFCRYGLGVKGELSTELDGARFGTLVHYVMQHLLPEYVRAGFDTLTRERVCAETALTVHRYVAETMGERQEQTARLTRLLDRLAATCGNLLWRVVQELRQSRYVPVDYELGIGIPDEATGEMIPATVLTLPDGSQVRVVGKVDRVDVCRRDNVAYVRVVDYKTGTKEFRLSDVVQGINVQMLIYLFSIWQNGGPRYGTVTPAGVLYLPSKQPIIPATRAMTAQELEEKRLKTMRMNGLLLDDPAVIRDMEPAAAGLFIPASISAKGELSSKSSVASLQQLGLLKTRIESLLTEMAKTLRRGDIAAVPLEDGENSACTHCDFRTVCGHESEDPVRPLLKSDAAAVLRDLEEKGSGQHSQVFG